MEKFADHLPLYRQSVIHAREGVDLEPRQPSCTRSSYGRH
ncbi:IS66 family transposase [Janthinobacterium sp. NKUCC06_STL]|nr:IS66 family transposase [Janthinobacterium sp. NKUCC06_STL]